jgi:hypothetical protein
MLALTLAARDPKRTSEGVGLTPGLHEIEATPTIVRRHIP